MLELKHISITFNEHTVNEKKALNDVSLKVNNGDFITIIGSNGAGKSTLLNCISGSYEVDEGQIILNGKHMEYMKEYNRAKKIGRLFQDPLKGTAPDMSIEENLELAYRRGNSQNSLYHRFFKIGLTKQERQLMKDKVSLLGLDLEKRFSSKVGLLSGGQRQALTLMMATINTPDLLLLDEHTAALDPKTAKQVMEITDTIIKEENITTIMITHNIAQALAYGNRLIMMNEGKILYEFSNEEKANLTIEDVMKLYQQKSHNDFSDSMLLD
ncbi:MULTISPECIES: ATP-binding cassette domain-containing protein [unclassified Breznakia]|uniref:ABC transporter ATP-binding protein n=1 Tax=unclassified Breznakia TaxID=2623764 RepID=UPI0024755A3F|nr:MULTISPECIES: ATP-binding cassette domain-containing protein [unclassified Breznakia]MDH6366197.1 putative ABC transport system ATP-binding protein [Breznakia sp. PH1-1]MDH6403290.1 putative ABC transport system ATP-binding protein [Breznakia sp. PF1-11]MDH6410999.1 putative ABC transport system ATP-binding protein [Breznakia sp. PFB1-11]MDH6413363.1 putative ABC transport system ATP-binding protein [Breznakia sp. PFB1-14]MDH6416128.1 putative ABC transport system ATP-binding protein [Brezn